MERRIVLIIAVILAVCIIPYLIGSINSSILISKAVNGKDIRSSGSGNAGTTNMLRVYGKKLAAVTLVIDVLKGVAAVLLGMFLQWLAGRYFAPDGAVAAVSPYFKYIGAIFVVVGHDAPVFFGFKGGKGVATSLGCALMLNWQVGLIVAAAALLVMAVTRYVSLGSVLSAVFYLAVDTAYMAVVSGFDVYRLIFDILFGAILVYKHKENIKRLLSGTENKLGHKKEKE